MTPLQGSGWCSLMEQAGLRASPAGPTVDALSWAGGKSHSHRLCPVERHPQPVLFLQWCWGCCWMNCVPSCQAVSSTTVGNESSSSCWLWGSLDVEMVALPAGAVPCSCLGGSSVVPGNEEGMGKVARNGSSPFCFHFHFCPDLGLQHVPWTQPAGWHHRGLVGLGSMG